MKVLLDASCLMKELTGIGVYVRDLLENMISMDSSIHYTIFMNALKGPTPEFEWNNEPNVTVVRRRIPGKVLLELWRNKYMFSIEKLASCSPDVFHSPNFLYQNSRSSRIVTTVHDLAFLKRKNYGDKYSGSYHRETLQKNISKASICTVVSDAVKNDLMEICGVPEHKIRVVHHGMNPAFHPPADKNKVTEKIVSIGYPENYLLSVGTIEPRKNFPLLVKAFSSIASSFPDLHLVIAGRPADGSSDLEKAIESSPVSDRITVCGYISFETLLNLYQGALAAVFPSWDEGFGFPALESVACGIPVFASDIPVYREVLGDVAWYFQPDSQDALRDCLKRVLSEPELMPDRQKAGLKRVQQFSWNAAARKHIDIYRSLMQ